MSAPSQANEETTTGIRLLQHEVRFSQSLLWDWQRNYFTSHGIATWSERGVPHYITSNPFIARAYARLAAAYVEDCLNVPSYDPAHPIYIVELGAGCGRFSYHFLKLFFDSDNSPQAPVKYVMTDLAPANVAYWQAHEQLAPYVDRGVLDFACCDIEREETIVLLHAGQTLDRETLRNPAIFIANYLFDSTPADLFMVQNHALHECLVNLAIDRDEPDEQDPGLIERFSISHKIVPCSTEYYDRPIWNRLLQEYAAHLEETTLLFPTAALACLDHLQAMTGGNLLLIIGDKGAVQESMLDGSKIPSPVLHSGCFSFSVNLHALVRSVEMQQGEALHAGYPAGSLNVVALRPGEGEAAQYPQTRQAYRQWLEYFGPDDYYQVTLRALEHAGELSLAEILSLLRLGYGDMRTLNLCYERLVELMPDALPAVKTHLTGLLDAIWAQYYRLPGEDNPAFAIATVLAVMGEYTAAAGYYRQAQRLSGNRPSIAFNLGLAYSKLGDRQQAIACLHEALEMNPDFEKASDLLQELEPKKRSRSR